ncbi:MAG: hypothetical protein LBC86_10290 [Oscillospiraceae bacterium]|jgi:hypothetical protein|nr:hypothetical protein [Oscillospiraceae bacterium]
MPSVPELRKATKDELYDLLKLKIDNEKANITVIGLNQLINKKQAGMEAEDVAYVEKIISELEQDK